MELTREVRDKRVAIARDVIERLCNSAKPLTDRPRVATGSYLGARFAEKRDAADLGEVISDLSWDGTGCSVCALGALLISKARLYDAVPFHQTDSIFGGYFVHYGGESVRDYLKDVFDCDTLGSIEAAFECWEHKPGGTFVAECDSAVERLEAIMRNVEDHDGEFIYDQPSGDLT